MGDLIPLFPLGTPLFPGIVLPLRIFEPRYRRLMHDLLTLPQGSDRRFFGVTAIRQGWEVERIAPAEALYDIGCTARLHTLRPEHDGGFSIVTVGANRFRLLEVVVGDDPPYLQGEVVWLDGEEAAEEAAGDKEGLVGPSATALAGRDALDEVGAAVARGSRELLVHGVRRLFTRYVAEVAALRLGWDADTAASLGSPGAEPATDDDAEQVNAQTAALLDGVADDPRALSFLVASVALLTTEDRQALLAISSSRRRLAAEARLLRRELTLLQTLRAVPMPLRQFAGPMTVN